MRAEWIDRASWLLTAIGALNWGLVGIARFDLVRALLGRDTLPTRTAYALVGLAGLWSALRLGGLAPRPESLEVG